MKRLLLLGVLVLYSFQLHAFIRALKPTHCFPNQEFSRTFMFTHPLSEHVAIQQSLWHNFIFNKERSRKSSFQMTTIGQGTLSTDRAAQYFLFCCRDSLLVLGDDAPDVQDRDIRAEWLNINNPKFRGSLKINPRQTQVGAIFEYHQDLGKTFDVPILEDYWISVEVPVVSVENMLNLQQFDILNTGTGCPRDIIEALNQRAYRYAKFPCKRESIGVSQIDIRFGKVYYSKHNFEVVYYSGVSLPTSDHQDAEYLFDSYLGNNGHFGFRTGVSFQVNTMRENCAYDVCWYFGLENLFLIRSNQMRTVDIKGKPWSRYLLFNRCDGPPDQNIPGPNILTCECTVRPYDIVDFSTGFRVKGDNFEIELGYSLWGHGDEQVRLTECFFPIYGIAGKGAFNPSEPIPTAASAACSDISFQAENDTDECGNPIFIPVCEADLDFSTAEAQAAINHKVHFAAGFFHYGCRIDAFFGGGLFWEFPQRNTALTIWGGWAKFGVTF